MRSLVATRLVLISLVGAAWLLPLIRALRLLDYALSVDNGSINAANDTNFGYALVLSYGFSFAVALALAWAIPSTRAWLLLVPLAPVADVAANPKREKALATRPHPDPLPQGEGGTFAAGLTGDARLDLATRRL